MDLEQRLATAKERDEARTQEHRRVSLADVARILQGGPLCVSAAATSTTDLDPAQAISRPSSATPLAMSVVGFSVPAWLVGSEDAVLRAIDATAVRWGATYRDTRSFPTVELVDATGLERIMGNTANMHPTRPAVRLFANCELIWKILDVAAGASRAQLIVDYENHVGAAAWGAFETFTCLREPWSRAALLRRLGLVRPHLQELAATVVVTVGQQRITALAALEQSVASTLAHWDARDGSLESRINHVLPVIAAESEPALRERIIRALVAVAPTMKRIRHPEKLSEAAIRARVNTLAADDYERLTACNETSLRSELYDLDRS